MGIVRSGFLRENDGTPIVGATVELFTRNATSTVLASATTTSAGFWTISHSDEGRYDVRVTSGSSVRFHSYDVAEQMEELEVKVLKIRDSNHSHTYEIIPANLAANRTITLPLLLGADTFAVLGFAQTFTANQTFGTDGTGITVRWNSATGSDYMEWNKDSEALQIEGTHAATALNVTDGNVVIADGTLSVTSTTDAANTIHLRANAGTSETIKLHADQGTSESSIQLLSDAGGVDINAATGKDVDVAGGTVNLTSSDDAASAIYLRANAGTSETIKIHADQGSGAASIELVSDAGGITFTANGTITHAANTDVGTNNLTFNDITLSRGAANRLDLASGDSLRLVAGDITVTAGSIQFQAGTGRLMGDGGTDDSIGWTSGAMYLNSRSSMTFNVDTDNNSTTEFFRWRFNEEENETSDGVVRMLLSEGGRLTLGATAYANGADFSLGAPGGVLIGGDNANGLFDDASGGSGSTGMYIGNAQITVSSDVRVKTNITEYDASALGVLQNARIVEYEWDDPTDQNEWGKNSRGRYVGMLGQEMIDWAPWIINAGAGRDCDDCRRGLACASGHMTWQVEYEHLVPLLVKAIQELGEKITALGE